METHDERISREARHVKKQTKKPKFKKGLAPASKEKNLYNKIQAEVYNAKEN